MKRIPVASCFALAVFTLAANGQTPVGAEPEANPGRPTVSTPATLTPTGYLQFETGTMAAYHSPEFSSQYALNEVIKFSVASRLEFLASAGPVAHSKSDGSSATNSGDVL